MPDESRPIPGLFLGTATMFRLSWLRLIRGRKLRLGVISIVLVLVVAWAARYLGAGNDPEVVMKETTAAGFFSLLVFLVPFLVHAGAIAEEVESRTFGYLAGRAAGRLAITLGKYAAGSAMALGLLLGGLMLAHIGIFITEPNLLTEQLPETLRTAGALALLTLYYGAICLFWGAVAPEAAGIVATLHLACIEFVLAFAPGVVRLVSMNHMARSLAAIEPGGLMPELVPDVSVPVAVGVLTTLVLLGVGLAAIVVQTSEYRYGRA